LVLDAGDFLEGNLYYMAKNGRKSFEVHNEIGYNAGTLGNHDYLMGSAELDKILGELDLKFSLVVANLEADKKYKNISRIIKPYKEFEIDGTKIAILGLTTDDMIFRWRLEGGKILDPIDTAKKYEQILKDRKNDVIIALTHIGVLADIKLAEKTKYIDLIVGGHSHSALFEPSYGINKNKRKVPVVQAGMHTEFLGRLVVDVVKGKPIKVVSYELIPITGEGLVDSNIKQMVQEADDELNASYGKDWLNGKIALSDLKAGDPEGSVKWAYFITDTMKEKANADIAIHVPSMNGENYPVGEITRRAIFNSIPRVFDLHEKFGWNIYTVKMKGVWLRVMMTALSYHGAPLTFSGLKLDYSRGPMGFKIRHITINGKNINPYKNYTVAFTEGIIKGATSVNPRTLAVLRNPVDSKIKIWSALEQRILEKAAIENSGKVSIVRALQENEHSLILL
jgi:2',3'-cyclic-nucleotide 2'-phosphodiesterase (5'-nucleotidase family)